MSVVKMKVTRKMVIGFVVGAVVGTCLAAGTIYAIVKFTEETGSALPSESTNGRNEMDSVESMLNHEDADAHIQILLNNISDYMVSENRNSTAAEDFVDDVHTLSAILKVRQYTTVSEDFLDFLKSI